MSQGKIPSEGPVGVKTEWSLGSKDERNDCGCRHNKGLCRARQRTSRLKGWCS